MQKLNNNSIGKISGGSKRYSYIKYAVFLFVLAGVVAGYLHKNNGKVSSSGSITVPTAYASDIPGWWYKQYFGASVCGSDSCKSDSDPDRDGLNNYQEFFYHTDPQVAYTVKDVLNDGELVAKGFDPSKPNRVTFEQAVSPENLLGESLVVGNDVKQMIADSNDISKITFPIVADDKIELIYSTDAATYRNYISQLHSVMDRYFPQDELINIQTVLKSGNQEQLMSIKAKSAQLALDLEKVKVPEKFSQFHKYNISMFQLLSEILPPPADIAGPSGDAWYDKMQSFLAVQQKLEFERQFLSKEFSK